MSSYSQQNTSQCHSCCNHEHVRLPSIANEYEIYMCCWGTCTKSFTSSEAFLDHLEWHIVSPPWKCLWRGCEKQAPCDHRSNLLQHVLMHTSFRPFKCSFSECSYSSPFEWCLRRHLKTHLKKRGRRVQRPCQPIKSLFSAIRSIECVRQPPRMDLAQEEGTASPALSVTPSTALLPQKFCNASNFIALVCLDDSENKCPFSPGFPNLKRLVQSITSI